jgi:hypothetical protein
MLDPFSGRPTFLRGAVLPTDREQAGLVEYHQRRLEAVSSLCQAAAECGITTDPDRHLIVLPEDEIAVLEYEGGNWAKLFAALHTLRQLLPILALETFGFPTGVDTSLDGNLGDLQRIGGGMEATVFQDRLGSVYKFFLPDWIQWNIGAVFRFSANEDESLQATAGFGTYRELLEKLYLLNMIGGMPTEGTGITLEGILIVKQALGRSLPNGCDTSQLVQSPSLRVPPSRFLHCDRAQPRLVFLHEEPWLIGDLHERNIAYDVLGAPRIIDLVAARIPPTLASHQSWLKLSADTFDAVGDNEL